MSAWNTPRGQLTRVGPWQLGDTLGRGAYAHVRRATNTITGREVACKILPALHASPGPKDWNDTLDAIEAHKEVIILKALSGANIPGVVGLEGVMQEEGWTYVFLTLHKGCLGSVHDPRGRNLIRFFRKLLRVVHALHQLGISHEDLKRSNILLSADEDGVGPALADFGFSQFFPDGGMVRSLGGTFDYSSPQKVADGPYDPCANDVWALGILLIKMLNLQHPYISKADDPKAARKRILQHPPIWAWTAHDLRTGRADLIEHMLDRNPTTRLTVLAHPYLKDADDKADLIKVPPLRLSSKVPRPVSPEVVQDVAFMSYLNKSFALCETTKLIQERLAAREPCWEKRWATMLAGWERSRDLQWEDLPIFPHMPVKNIPRLAKTIKPLKPIYLSPITGMPMANEHQSPAMQPPRARSTLAPPEVQHTSPPKANTPLPATTVTIPVPSRTRAKAMKTKAESTTASGSTAVTQPSNAKAKASGGKHVLSGAENSEVGSSGSSTAVSYSGRVPLGIKKTVHANVVQKIGSTNKTPMTTTKRPADVQINVQGEDAQARLTTELLLRD